MEKVQIIFDQEAINIGYKSTFLKMGVSYTNSEIIFLKKDLLTYRTVVKIQSLKQKHKFPFIYKGCDAIET